MLDEEFIKICNESDTMSEACSKIGVHFNTFKRKAIKLGCYDPNPGGKGTKKEWLKQRAIPLSEILEGKHPQYQTFKLKNRLIQIGLKKNECEECGISSWNGKKLMCELDHINGDSKNHKIENLKMLCPNCHSQTETFRAKNIGRLVE
jgi:ribosomal protein S27AE